MTTRRRPAHGFALCIEPGEYEAHLVVGKVYRVVTPEPRDRKADIRIVDESGEDYLYPRGWFVPLDLPAKAKKALTSAAAT
jgi:hypothetical protein